jgi:hypothetical protein
VTARTAYLLVTGSRNFTDYPVVAEAASVARREALAYGFTRLVGVHGNAPGADSLFDRWCKANDVLPKPFPAHWEADCIPGRCKPDHRGQRRDGSTYCPAEGHYRNERMVKWLLSVTGPQAVLVLAFWAQPKSRGTANCVDLAKAAGFTVRPFGNPPAPKGAPECPPR